MHTLNLHYSLENCGDGSVSMRLVESAKLAKWMQENDICDEGWAEDCSGTIVLKSESPIVCEEEIETIEDMIENYEDCGDDKKIQALKDMVVERDA